MDSKLLERIVAMLKAIPVHQEQNIEVTYITPKVDHLEVHYRIVGKIQGYIRRFKYKDL